MDPTSDTESETSETNVPLGTSSEEKAPSLPAKTPLLQPLNPAAKGQSTEHVNSAVRSLASQDLRGLLDNIDDLNDLQEPADILINFVRCLPNLLSERTDTLDALATFSSIGVSSLLNIQSIFRLLAYQEKPDSRQSIVVTWVDVFLGYLSLSAPAIALSSQSSTDSSHATQTIEMRREEDAIRAMAQLPGEGLPTSMLSAHLFNEISDSWNDVGPILGSMVFSRAARRVATSLVFIAYVLTPQLTDDGKWPGSSSSARELWPAIYSSTTDASTQLYSPSPFGNDEYERIGLAMLLSATAAELGKETTPELLSLRPARTAALLGLVRFVMNQYDDVFLPLERLDAAQSILVRCGSFVPWSWSIWADHRIANVETLISLNATWFFHLDAPVGERRDLNSVFRSDRPSLLKSDNIGCTAVITCLLLEILANINLNSAPQSVLLCILAKICLVVIQYFEANLVRNCPNVDEQTVEFSRCLLLVFPSLGSSADCYIVKSLITEALSLVQKGLFAVAVGNVTGDNKNLFSFKLEKAMKLSAAELSEPGVTDVDMNNVKSLLEFSTILLMHFKSDNSTSLYTATGGFAQYLTVCDGFDDSLLCQEAWHYLLDSLSSAIAGQFLDDEEPLVLITCTAICNGLRKLLQSPSAFHLLRSPWTSSLKVSLMDVVDNGRKFPSYIKAISERLGGVGRVLLEEMADFDLVKGPDFAELKFSGLVEKRPLNCSWNTQMDDDFECCSGQPAFASTSAQFNLFPSVSNDSTDTADFHNLGLLQKYQRGHLSDLVRLHSTAFWDLRRTIAENGEGLVRRMREYERARSRNQAHFKAKAREAEKRGQKRWAFHSKKTLYSSSASEDSEDDVLIFSDDSASHIPEELFFWDRTRSLAGMDVDIPGVGRQSACSSPDIQYPSNSSALQPDAEQDSQITITLTNSASSLPRSAPGTLDSPSALLTTSSTTTLTRAAPARPVLASDRALAALSLALANGAGSIEDYSAVQRYQEGLQADRYDIGDLWR
ncbi:hypothetical protein NLJ89_g546 [Agrocybe chaxingu]|uniref:Uncharacterized protein n=1 Tax=Agrocybe chaxingu TaxID=84603 RepID=A0A9W8N1U5_9AGAR|nr:hypothetical protein NLJ89_g546 [Agrocybe chaxingu]